MDPEIEVQELIERVAARVGAEILLGVEDLAPGVHQMSVEDPSNRGAPITLIWSPGGSVVVHIGNGGARLEEPLTAAGAAELERILVAVFLGGAVETVYASGADLCVRYQEDDVARLRVRKGIFPRKGKVVSETIYHPYGGD